MFLPEVIDETYVSKKEKKDYPGEIRLFPCQSLNFSIFISLYTKEACKITVFL